MAVALQPADSLVADLLERIATARDVVEAASFVLDSVVEEAGYARAVLVLRDEDAARAIGWGVDDPLMGRVLADRDAELLDLLPSEDGPSRLLTEPAVFAAMDFEASVLIPILLPDGRILGAVFGDADELGPGAERSGVLLRRTAAALERAMELERLAGRQDKLGHQRDLLTGIVNSLADPVILTDAQNNILLANRRAEQLLSATSEDSEGRRRAVQINNLLFTSFLTQAVIGVGSAGSRELNLVDPSDGSDLLFEVISAEGPPTSGRDERGLVSILRDITDLKRAVSELESEFNRSRVAEHRARRERDRLNAILENVSDPILVTDDQSNLILMNREAERLFVVQSRTEGDTADRRRVRANDTKVTTLISDFLLQPDRRRVERVELVDPESGVDFSAEAVSSKILNERNEPVAIVTIVHDLTQVVENQRLARELRDLNEDLEDRIVRATRELAERNTRLEWQSRELEKASRLKSEFLANMSHELRTPINALLGYTALMQERIYGDLTEKQHTALDKIRGASRHLLDLINDILDLSKIEAGKMQVHLEEVRLQEIGVEVAQTLEPMVASKGLRFVRELEPDLPAILSDRTKIRQIVLNLLSNAIKFTHEGSVTLRVTGSGTKVRISVQDTGIGISPENLQSIFEEFRQVDGSHTREYGGTGLGLSITKKLIDLLGGRISVASARGSGSTFDVELPIGGPSAPDEA
ncbi:MAG TPA: ATP-binding protein [Longimicrobiales bacterium]|nr:ATP-binding protein [Longimicrobiales bacterium]